MLALLPLVASHSLAADFKAGLSYPRLSSSWRLTSRLALLVLVASLSDWFSVSILVLVLVLLLLIMLFFWLLVLSVSALGLFSFLLTCWLDLLVALEDLMEDVLGLSRTGVEALDLVEDIVLAGRTGGS